MGRDIPVSGIPRGFHAPKGPQTKKVQNHTVGQNKAVSQGSRLRAPTSTCTSGSYWEVGAGTGSAAPGPSQGLWSHGD